MDNNNDQGTRIIEHISSNPTLGTLLAQDKQVDEHVASEHRDENEGSQLQSEGPIQSGSATSEDTVYAALFDRIGTLWTQFMQSGRRDQMEDAVALHRSALELLPASHPHQWYHLHQLALALQTQFHESGGQPNQLDEAILLYRDQPSDSNQLESLNNLANAIFTRFEQYGQRGDLDEAISLYRNMLELMPSSHPLRYGPLNNLANVLQTRFDQSDRREDIEEAISLYREILELPLSSNVDRSFFFNNLANILRIQFEQLGRRDDLDEAISLHRDALELRPPSHPERSDSLNNLAVVLNTRFEQSGRREDLEEAIPLHRDALKAASEFHSHRHTYLGGLAASLRVRFLQSGRDEDLDEAIALHRDTLELMPASHAERHSTLNNLATALAARFGQSGRPDVLDEAIQLHRETLELRPAPHSQRSKSLINLAEVLRMRFQKSHRSEDLEEAIKLSLQTLATLVGGHPLACVNSGHLGYIYIVAFKHTQDSDYLHKAMNAYQMAVACEAAPASMRFGFAKEWARHADSRHASALDAYHAAIQLLPRLAMLGLDLPSRRQALTSGSDGLARDAAACAIRLGQYGKAVELLEEGRAVFWSQALQLRTPVSDLRDVAPELGEKLRNISLALEQASPRGVSQGTSNTHQKMMEREASQFRRLNDEWLEALEEVRQLEGFQDFLRPTRLSTLLVAATQAPVVILNASNAGCAALILSSTRVQHVPLALTSAHTIQLVKLLRICTAPGSRDSTCSESIRSDVEGVLQQMPLLSNTLQSQRVTSESRKMERTVYRQSNDIFGNVLAILWELVVKPVIRSLALEKSDVPSNLWWCPTGPFAFLPIHAAGIYDTEKLDCISDYVVSSYTPTINALLGAIPPPPNPFKMMVVIQPKTPGQKPLPYTVNELRRIEAHVPNKELIKLVSGTVEEAISHLSGTSIIHFACHGQHHVNPLESALILQDGRLTISQIMQQSMSDAALAFLSACETAMGDEQLPDEVIHLASALLFAGFQGVVATMWSISDEDGPKVADIFYENLFSKNNSTMADKFRQETTHAAKALHLAVTKLRSEGVSFLDQVSAIITSGYHERPLATTPYFKDAFICA